MHTFASRFLVLLLILLLLSGILIALIPTLASTDWGRQQVIYWINRSIPGSVEIRHLNLHWSKGQEIEGFLLKDQERQVILEIGKFSTEGSLWQLLNKSTRLGFTQIKDLNAIIKGDLTNLQRALGIDSNQEAPLLSPSTIVLSDVNADGYLFADHHPLSIQMRGLTRQEDLNGSFEIHLALNGLWASHWDELKHNARNFHNWQKIGVNAKLNGQQLTPALVQSLFPLTSDQKQKLHAFFGNVFDIRAHLQLQNLTGPIQASVKGDQGYIQLEGQLNQGILTLDKPLEGSVEMTPLFSQIFLAPNIPLLSTAIGAENRITFTLDPSQFSYPLIPFQLANIKIGKGSLNLGKIRFRNEGELNTILNLIRPLPDPYLTIWFTPIYFELEHGILLLKRIDMLVAQTYPLANWGTINLMTHQTNFVLGVPSPTLQYAFGIQGLDENYILQIPLHSANGKVEIDKKKAMTRISSLIAQTYRGKKVKLLDNILDMALSEKSESPYPSPTTQPLPWQGEFYSPQQAISSDSNALNSSQSEEKENRKKKKKKHKLLDSDNLKDLQDDAIQLLEQWLGQ
jgi:hypothetical protein